MRRSVGLLLFAAAALVAVISGCKSGGQNGQAAQPTPTLSLGVPGDPSVRVTDIRAYALTPRQAQDISAKCRQEQGVPVDAQGCAYAVQQFPQSLVASPGTGTPIGLCTVDDHLCLVVGAAPGRTNAIVQIVDPQPGETSCEADGGSLCAGVKLPGSYVPELVTPGPSASASSGSSAPAPSVSPGPASSTPTPVTSAGPTGSPPADPAETGPGSSP
jgi:hypothetical protein